MGFKRRRRIFSMLSEKLRGFDLQRIGIKKPADVPGSALPAVIIGLFVAFGGILFGYDTGTIGGIIAMRKWLDMFSTGYIDPATGMLGITSSQSSLIVSILSAGTFFGALTAAPIGDWLGRRIGLFVTTIIFSFGVLLQTASTAIPLFVAGRFFAGFGVGLISALIPMYQSETAPKWIRGTIVGAYQLAITIGLLLAAVVDNATKNRMDTGSYRIPVALQFAWALILATGLIFLPETPRYLIKAGQRYHAAQSLQALQQLTGVHFIFYYGTSYFKSSGIKNPFIISMITSSINVASTFPGLYLVEAWGRRRLLLFGAVGMAVCQLIVASVGTAFPGSENLPAQKALIAFVCIYIFFFASTWGPGAWVVTGEIFPLGVRAKGLSITTASNWLLNWAIAYSTPYLVNSGPGNANLQSKIFFIWGGCCILCGLFVWGMIYETKGLSLEEVDEMYEKVDNAWQSHGFVPSFHPGEEHLSRPSGVSENMGDSIVREQSSEEQRELTHQV